MKIILIPGAGGDYSEVWMEQTRDCLCKSELRRCASSPLRFPEHTQSGHADFSEIVSGLLFMPCMVNFAVGLHEVDGEIEFAICWGIKQ